MTAEQLYQERRNTPHNIDQHLPFLRHYASACVHVTEFGVERGWSTSAFLASDAQFVRSYDLMRWPEVDLLEQVAETDGVDFKFILGDTREVEIEETDLLFVDTDHTYEQVKTELTRHLPNVRKYVIFHDTVSCPQILPAIEECCPSDEWERILNCKKQNGLLVLRRKGALL